MPLPVWIAPTPSFRSEIRRLKKGRRQRESRIPRQAPPAGLLSAVCETKDPAVMAGKSCIRCAQKGNLSQKFLFADRFESAERQVFARAHGCGQIFLCHAKSPPKAGFLRGAEDEIRTRATGKGTTPLAGEPLEPLGYFCIRLNVRRVRRARGALFSVRSITIPYLRRIVKVYFRENAKKSKKMIFISCGRRKSVVK